MAQFFDEPTREFPNEQVGRGCWLLSERVLHFCSVALLSKYSKIFFQN